jgi:hypothetical protein
MDRIRRLDSVCDDSVRMPSSHYHESADKSRDAEQQYAIESAPKPAFECKELSRVSYSCALGHDREIALCKMIELVLAQIVSPEFI